VPNENALAGLIRRKRQDILAGWEAGVRTLASGARAPRPALVNRLPGLLDWLAERLEGGEADDPQGDAFGHDHATERLSHGFDLVEVLAEWTLLRDVLLEAWEAEPAGVTAADVRRLSSELDHVITLSVVQYVRELSGGAPQAAMGLP
jgi:hypothetical protein